MLTFRGTASLRNTLADAQIQLVDVPYCAGCRGFSGFYRAWLEAAPVLREPVLRARAEHPDYRVVVAGHSYGGAAATFAAMDLRAAGIAVDLVGSLFIFILIFYSSILVATYI